MNDSVFGQFEGLAAQLVQFLNQNGIDAKDAQLGLEMLRIKAARKDGFTNGTMLHTVGFKQPHQVSRAEKAFRCTQMTEEDRLVVVRHAVDMPSKPPSMNQLLDRINRN